MENINAEEKIQKFFKTTSLCPYCFKKIDAIYIGKEDDNIYLRKVCDEHGPVDALVWEGIDDWKKWVKPLMNYEVENPFKEIEKGCPYDCGICSDHRQKICCILFEVTERCNLNCPTCFASAVGDSSKDPSLEEISNWYDRVMSTGGPYNIQLSGGEPTVRDDLSEIIKIGREKGFNFFQLNTNGIRIGEDIEYLKKLQNSGLDAVFLQFDGFKEETYIKLRGKNILDKKLQAIENCKKLGIGVKLVPTIRRGINDSEIGGIIDFAIENMPYIRGVHFQPMSFFGRYDKSPENSDRMTVSRMMNEIEKQTEGRFKRESFRAGNSGHFMCTFDCDFIVESKEDIKAVGQGSKCCSGAKVKDIVANKWRLPSLDKLEELIQLDQSKLDSLGKFLVQKEINTLTISCMAFQDIWNVDIERLKRCYVFEYSKDEFIVPFCAYNITNMDGDSLYRK